MEEGKYDMIGKILDVVFSIIEFFVGLLPVWTPQIPEGVQEFLGEIWAFQDFFPVETLLLSAGVILTFEVTVLVARPILKFIRLS
jgi:hypothetical protein